MNERKELIAFTTAVVSLIIGLISLAKVLPPSSLIVTSLLFAAAGCLFVLHRRQRSRLETNEMTPFYTVRVRAWARVLLIGVLLLLIVGSGASFYHYQYVPRVLKTLPSLPVAGGRVTILGRNFSLSRDKLSVSFEGTQLQVIDPIRADMIELLLPREPKRGRLSVTNKLDVGPLNLSPSGISDWIEIRPAPLVYLTERVTNAAEEAQIFFSIRNTTDDQHLVIFDVLINFWEPPQPLCINCSVMPRYDLGAVVLNQHLQKIASTSSFFFDRFKGTLHVTSLKPNEAEAFTFKVTHPDFQHCLFSVIALYHDNRGVRAAIYSDRIYRVMVDFAGKFTAVDLLSWDKLSPDQNARLAYVSIEPSVSGAGAAK